MNEYPNGKDKVKPGAPIIKTHGKLCEDQSRPNNRRTQNKKKKCSASSSSSDWWWSPPKQPEDVSKALWILSCPFWFWSNPTVNPVKGWNSHKSKLQNFPQSSSSINPTLNPFSLSAKYLNPCSLSDPQLNACAKKHGNEAIPSIVEGESFPISPSKPKTPSLSKATRSTASPTCGR